MSIKTKIKTLLGERMTAVVVKSKYGFFNMLCNLLPMNDEIILESHPDFTCNTFAIYQYMLEQGVNKKYKLTWLVRDMEKYSGYDVENVEFLPISPKSLRDRIKKYIRCNRAKVVLTSKWHVANICVSKKQLNIFLDHGSQLKSMLVDNKRFRLRCGYINCQSEFFGPLNLSQYDIEADQIIYCGLPRNDELFMQTDSLKRLVDNVSEYKKVIFWAPTFRKHYSKVRVDCNMKYFCGLPLFKSSEDAVLLSEALDENNVLMVIKPHPSSDMSEIKELNLKNILFLYNEDFEKADVQLNEILAQTDAMITDYSSIYYDYLLLDRPIALTLDDYHEYATQKGFVFDDPLEILKGEYVYSVHELCTFVKKVADGDDEHLEERTTVKNLVHTYQDNKSCERLYNFIMEKLSKD